MFTDRRIRVALLAVGLIICITFMYIRDFAGFAGEWERTRPYQPEKNAIIMKSLLISSVEQGVLITGLSDAIDIKVNHIERSNFLYHYNKVLRDDPVNDNAVPLLNLQINPDKAVINKHIAKQIGKGSGREIESYRPRLPLTQIMTEQEGELRVRARFIGNVLSQQCDNQGRCLIVFKNDITPGRPAFYSNDGGLHWQWLQQWASPETRAEENVLAITGAGHFVMAQNERLYQTMDFGQTWKKLADLNRSGRGRADLGSYQHYNIQDPSWLATSQRAIFWKQESDTSSLTCINFQTGRQEAYLSLPGRVSKPTVTPEGEVYFVLKTEPRMRYSINRLDCSNGNYTPVLETGTDSISDLYAGKDNSLIFTFRFNDPEHIRVSHNGGKNWKRMQKFPRSYQENVLFDGVRNRLFYFPVESYYAPDLGNRDGLVYEISPI